MSIGVLASVEEFAAPGPLFLDRVSMVGDAAYVNGTGIAGLETALRALRGDSRTIVSVKQAKDPVDTATGLTSYVGYRLGYNVESGKLTVSFEDQTSGVVAEVSSGSLAAKKFFLEIVSK